MSNLSPVASTAGSRVRAGIGAISFSVSTVAALVLANPPGGNYSSKTVTDYLANGHRIEVIVVMHLALFGLVGLLYLLAHFRTLLGPGTAQSVFWGTGVAAAAAFAVGWGFVGGQVVAHWEGGSAIAIPLSVTYLVSEVGVVLVYGSGAVLLGCALIVFVLDARAVIPTWLRRLTLVAGVAGIGGLAFFTFYLLMLWGIVVGVWLVAGGSRASARSLAPEPIA
jgi:hypothetical protein